MADRDELEGARHGKRIADNLSLLAEGVQEMLAQQRRDRRAFSRLLLAVIEHADEDAMPASLREELTAAIKELGTV